MVEDEVAPGRTWQSIKQRYGSYPAEQDSPCLTARALITFVKSAIPCCRDKTKVMFQQLKTGSPCGRDKTKFIFEQRNWQSMW